MGARIRRLRLERGLSQRELSGPGVSYAYVSRIEAGQRDPSLKALRILARKLGVSLEHLETGAGVSESAERELLLADAELELRVGEDVRGAEESFRALILDARESGDTFAEARARVGLGLALWRGGDARQAAAELERALDADGVAPEVRPDAYVTLARAYRDLGMPPQAVRLLERCIEEVGLRTPEDGASAALYGTYLSRVLDERGEAASARVVLLEAKERLEAVAGVRTRIRLYWSLARAASEERRFDRALAYLRRATALLEATEDTTELARAHLSCARMLVEEGRRRGVISTARSGCSSSAARRRSSEICVRRSHAGPPRSAAATRRSSAPGRRSSCSRAARGRGRPGTRSAPPTPCEARPTRRTPRFATPSLISAAAASGARRRRRHGSGRGRFGARDARRRRSR